jgi:hypothetical protein|tara:strand:+ start:30 stop:563 length:534 start_codon:yes stop_codon:yes gene_type:complete
MILGLDVSTSITGATVIDLSGNVVYCEAWDTRKIKNFFDKASFINNKLMDIRIEFPITKIVIEQSLQMFRAGFSSAKTLTLLSKFNGVVSWLCYNVFAREPEYVSASSARKASGVKIQRGQKAKAVVLKFVLDNVGGFEVEYTRNNNPKPGSYDRADSYIIAQAGYLECQKERKNSS